MSLRVVVRVPPVGSPAATASVSTSSADEDASDDQHSPRESAKKKRPHAKKRKSSYLVRKEAMSALREQEELLHAQLQELKDQAAATRSASLQYALEENRALQLRVAMNRLTIAGVHSITSSVGSQLEGPPLGDYIHLPRDPVERRHLLQSLKPHKIDAAVRFMLARAQSHDLGRRTRQIETFETADGDHVVLDCGVATFTQQGLTVQRVYDEMLAFAHTHEMTLADKLGVIAIRESDTCVDSMDVAEVRSLTSHGPNLLIEKNLAVFTEYFACSDLLDRPHGLLLFDYIDQDDVYPYQPLTRIRKDVSSVSVVMECPPEPGRPSAIAVIKWSYNRIHKSPLATEDELAGIAREGSFFDLMVQTVREQLAWKTS